MFTKNHLRQQKGIKNKHAKTPLPLPQRLRSKQGHRHRFLSSHSSNYWQQKIRPSFVTNRTIKKKGSWKLRKKCSQTIDGFKFFLFIFLSTVQAPGFSSLHWKITNKSTNKIMWLFLINFMTLNLVVVSPPLFRVVLEIFYYLSELFKIYTTFINEIRTGQTTFIFISSSWSYSSIQISLLSLPVILSFLFTDF